MWLGLVCCSYNEANRRPINVCVLSHIFSYHVLCKRRCNVSTAPDRRSSQVLTVVQHRFTSCYELHYQLSVALKQKGNALHTGHEFVAGSFKLMTGQLCCKEKLSASYMSLVSVGAKLTLHTRHQLLVCVVQRRTHSLQPLLDLSRHIQCNVIKSEWTKQSNCKKVRETCVMAVSSHTHKQIFLFNRNMSGESYKSKHRCCTSAFLSHSFASCECCWKVMERCQCCLSSSVLQRAMLHQPAPTARWMEMRTYWMRRCFHLNMWSVQAEILLTEPSACPEYCCWALLLDTHDHITPILASLHWLLVGFRIDFKVLLLVSLSFFFSTHLLVVLRSRPKLKVDRAFAVTAPKLWDRIPLLVTLALTL